MSRVVALASCIARPGQLLMEHLLAVKRYMEACVRAFRTYPEQHHLVQLVGLAGLCHDMAKCHPDWQSYIRKETASGPTHAPEGAFLFSYLGYRLIERMDGDRETLQMYWMWLTRDIADHHGALKSVFDSLRWMQNSDWERMDLDGFHRLACEHYPALRDVELTVGVLDGWGEQVSERLEEVQRDWQFRSRRMEREQRARERRARELQQWRQLTTALIAGDRFDLARTIDRRFTLQRCLDARRSLDGHCLGKSDDAMTAVRIAAQDSLLQQLAEQPDRRFYTIELPTGYGKTIASLKLALLLVERAKADKIVYVAPYLAILEQTAADMSLALGIRALEHHSLAMWDEQEAAEGRQQDEGERHDQRAPDDQLAMESWANEFVCTSFQQFSRAVFPRRAQDTLRRALLANSVVLIDEPQIFDPAGWKTFLCGLEALVEEYELHVIFLSATMPPFEHGLSEVPVTLAYRTADRRRDRYRVTFEPSMDESALAAYVEEREERTKCVILNTIKDACLVHEQLDRLDPDPDGGQRFLVHGLMIPLHKKMIIARIQSILEHNKKHKDDTIPLTVVSTQLLEAGVNVSFELLGRALATLPSLAQAAGRVNRHGELGDHRLGHMVLFDFKQQNKRSTRSYIYDPNLSRITDDLLGTQSEWRESDMDALVVGYYSEMFRHNRYETMMAAIEEAHRGNWPALAQFEPFGQDLFRLPLFVPWEVPPGMSSFVPEVYRKLQEELRLYSPEDIYERRRDRTYWKSGDRHSEWRKVSILFYHHILNVPFKMATRYASKEDYLEMRIPILQDTDAYHSEKGLSRDVDNILNRIM